MAARHCSGARDVANALTQGYGAPPAPNPDPQSTSGGGNALGGPMASPGPTNGVAPNIPPQAQAPAPNHQQTVAALRHFSAIEKELTVLLADPSLGKSDLKSKIQDGAVGLVKDGILTPVQAVTMLGTVPDEPFKQKQWLETHFQQATQAATAVLAHHQAAFAGQAVDTTPPNPDDHATTMQSLTGLYQNAQAGGQANG